MGYTSSNALGRTHFGGDVVAGGSKPNRNGISLDAVSTGSTPGISARGDDATIGLNISAKSTGTVQVGGSSNRVALGSSGTAFTNIIRGTSTFVYPALAANAWGASTVTAAGVSTASIVNVQAPSSMSTNYVMTGAYASGANEITVGFLNNAASTQGTGFSTSDVLRWSAINF